MRLTSEVLGFTFAGNTVAVWLIAAGIFAGVVITLFVARTVLARRLKRMAARTTTEVDDVLVDLLSRTRYYFIVAIALSAGSLVLLLPTPARQTIKVISILAITVQTAVWGNGLISFWLKSYAARRAAVDGASVTTIGAFGVLARIALWVIVVLLAIDNLGYSVTTLVTGLGITGVAVALAVQNILGDLFAALAIVVDKPFVVGDAIAVDTFNGTVEHVGLKTTRLRSVNGEQVVFSNSDLLKSRIRNFRRQEERRVVFVTSVSYETAPAVLATIPGILRDIITSHEHVRFDRSHLFRQGEWSLDFETVYFVTTADYLTYMDVQQAITLAILEKFRAEGIQIPFPTRTLLVRQDATGGDPSAALRHEG